VKPTANLSAIGRAYGIGRDALRRHRDSHLPGLLRDFEGEAEALRGRQLHHQAQDLYKRALANLAEAEQGMLTINAAGQTERKRSARAVASAIREVRATLELLARLAVVAPTGAELVEGGRIVGELDAAVDRALRAAVERSMMQRAAEVAEAEVIEDSHYPKAELAILPSVDTASVVAPSESEADDTSWQDAPERHVHDVAEAPEGY
jgi:hypothetical protein